MDVTNASAVEAATATTLDQLGTVDILVNNAGFAGESKKLRECTPEEWQGRSFTISLPDAES